MNLRMLRDKRRRTRRGSGRLNEAPGRNSHTSDGTRRHRGIAAAQWFQTVQRILLSDAQAGTHDLKDRETVPIAPRQAMACLEGDERLRVVQVSEVGSNGVRFQAPDGWQVGQRLWLSFTPPHAYEPPRKFEVVSAGNNVGRMTYGATVVS